MYSVPPSREFRAQTVHLLCRASFKSLVFTLNKVSLNVHQFRVSEVTQMNENCLISDWWDELSRMRRHN